MDFSIRHMGVDNVSDNGFGVRGKGAAIINGAKKPLVTVGGLLVNLRSIKGALTDRVEGTLEEQIHCLQIVPRGPFLWRG